jgi:hypothetical protein
LCSKGYPADFEKQILIEDLRKIKLGDDEYCYHAGTTKIENEVATSNDLAISIGGQHFVNVNSEHVTIVEDYFSSSHKNKNQNQNNTSIINQQQQHSSSLLSFPIGTRIKVKNDFAGVELGFEIGKRDDCWPWMKQFCSAKGTVIMHHPTNGLYVQFDDYTQASNVWYEPNCITVIEEDEHMHSSRFHESGRLLVSSKVRFVFNQSEFDQFQFQFKFHQR